MILGLALMLSSCGSSNPSPSSSTTSSTSSSGASAACGPSSAQTLAAAAHARVYQVGRTVFACAGATRYALGLRAVGCLGGGRVQAVTVSASFVAYAVERCGVDTGQTTVEVRRLTDGKVLANLPAITQTVAPESFRSVGSIVLRSDGAVAWIATLTSVISHRRASEVHKADVHGAAALLDASATAPLGALTLSGSTLSWTHGGARRSATLG